jgi:hypothetical protein
MINSIPFQIYFLNPVNNIKVQVLFDDIILMPVSTSAYATGFKVRTGFRSRIVAHAAQYP